MTTLEKINKLLTYRYSKKLAEINKSVYSATSNEDGTLNVPTIEVGPGGGTIITKELGSELAPPAKVAVKVRPCEPVIALYRLVLPQGEVEIAASNENYFNHLFDRVIAVALERYTSTFGPVNKIRFGECFLSFGDGVKEHYDVDTGEYGYILELKGKFVDHDLKISKKDG
jgi:hypothetical protein